MHLYLLVVLMFSMSGMGLFGALTEGMSGDCLLYTSSPYFCKLISPIGMLGLWKLFIQLLAQFQYSGID